MTSIVINGNPYSDDGSTANDMQHYGYLTHLLPMIGDTATVAGEVQANADQAAIDAATASNAAAALHGTSATSLTVAAGTQTITTQAGKQFTAGSYVTVSRTSSPATMMHGVVTSYSGTSLVVSVTVIAGSGTFTDWSIALSGSPGAAGPSGNGQLNYITKTAAYTVTAADKGAVIDCTSGTFTLSFQACASLGSDWTTYIRNSGTGTITLSPSGAETINGGLTYVLHPGWVTLIQSNGSALTVCMSNNTYGGVIHVQDQKPTGSHGGGSITGENLRVLNTVIKNTILGASLSGNYINLPAGTYEFLGRTSAGTYSSADAGYARAVARTSAGDVFVGSGTYVSNAFPLVFMAVCGFFTMSVPGTLCINTQHSRGSLVYGLGGACALSGLVEVYSDLQVRKVG